MNPASVSARDVVVVDQGNMDVREFDEETGVFDDIFDDTTGNLNSPVDLAFHPVTGNLFVSDTGTDDIRVFSDDDDSTSSDGLSFDFLGSFGETPPNLSDPRGLAFHPLDESLLVADSGNGDLRVFSGSTGAFIGSVGAANLTAPVDVAFHPNTGNIMVADTSTHDVREFDGATGSFVGIFGETASNLMTPEQLLFDPTSGNLLVSDSGNGDVREFDGDSGAFIGSINDSTNSFAPFGMTFNPKTDNLLVSDTTDDDIKEFDRSGGNFLGVFAGSSNLGNPMGLAVEPEDEFPGGLKVTPVANKKWKGFLGGSFKPPRHKYKLQNKNSITINYLVRIEYKDPIDEEWIEVEGTTTGTLAPNQKTDILLKPSDEADNLDTGIYTAMVTFADPNNVVSTTMRTITLLVGGDKKKPLAIGKKGFKPACIRGACNKVKENFPLTNFGENTVNFSATSNQNWLDISIGSGDAIPDGPVAMADLPVAAGDTTVNGSTRSGETTTLTATVNSNASGVSGDSTATITVTDTSSGDVLAQDVVILTVVPDPFAVASKNRVVSPYWQADPTSYTFLVVSHPSLTGMSSEIGVVMTPMQNDGAPFGEAAEFTVSPGESQRIFIVSTNNPTVNPSTQPGAGFITGPAELKFGQLVIGPKASDPTAQVGPMGVPGRGAPDVRMLNFWGAIVIQQTVTGFAMEFIGDNQDSRAFNTPYFSGVN